jgi:hypothetical protein
MRLLRGKFPKYANRVSFPSAMRLISTPAMFREPLVIAFCRLAAVSRPEVSLQVVCPAGAMDVVVTLPVTPLTRTAIDVLHPPLIPAGTTKLI